MKLKKKVKRNILIIVVVALIILLGFVIWSAIRNSNEEVKEVKVISQIDKYGYKLKENKPKAYKDMFKELEDILKEKEVDEEAYVKKISEMFIYDFYSLDDKAAKTDIGGVDFVYESIAPNFLQNAQDTYYKYVESNIYNNRNQKLPIVKDINVISTDQSPFAYGEETDEEAYNVEITWDYTDSAFSTYQKTATLVFIHDGVKLSLVELR